MQPRPADLTQIAVRRGRFNRDAVASYIDGRMEVEPHGPREMPVWARRSPDAPEMRLTPQMIVEIVAYLETIQAKPELRPPTTN
jgi:hypothetical protein